MPPPLITLKQLTKSYGAEPLFSEVELTIAEGERLAIIGANGSGKSTLLAIAAGVVAADEGERIVRKGSVTAYVQQERSFDPELSISAILAAELVSVCGQLADYDIAARVATTAAQAGFDDVDQAAGTLSGGWRKRLAIACGLIIDPDLLLLDEPTNHLDIDSLLWLEALIQSSQSACVLVTHDRWLLDRLQCRVLEIDGRYPGGTLSASGGYAAFVEHRRAWREARESEQASLANRHRREQAWLARQPKARTTKNVARIKRAEELGRDLNVVSGQTAATRQAGIDFTASGRRTQDLLVAEDLRLKRGDKVLFEGLECTVGPGDRIGVLGRNGSGKSSLLKVLLGDIPADAGTVRRAAELRIATFAQSRANLDQTVSLLQALAPNGKTVHVGDREWHVNAWAQRFLFTPEQLRQQVSELSGGEQARLLIAQLMTRPADLLVLDEPTNDLDIPALEALEASLTSFPGGVLLVTHDRALLDRIATICIALNGDGDWQRTTGYGQWEAHLRQRPASSSKARDDENAAASQPSTTGNDGGSESAGLTYAEQKELRNIEGRIAKAEADVESCQRALEDPKIATDMIALQKANEALAAAQQRSEALVERWAELSERSDS